MLCDLLRQGLLEFLNVHCMEEPYQHETAGLEGTELTVDVDVSCLPHGFDETQAFAADFARQIWWRKTDKVSRRCGHRRKDTLPVAKARSNVSCSCRCRSSIFMTLSMSVMRRGHVRNRHDIEIYRYPPFCCCSWRCLS